MSRAAEVACIGMATGRACAPAACVQWSDEGQLLVVTRDALHIVTPRAKARHHAHIHIAATDARYDAGDDVHEDPVGGVVPSAVHGHAWYAAAWSPSGVGPWHTCVLAAVDARRHLSLYASEKGEEGPWPCVYTLERQDEAHGAAAMCTAMAWKPGATSPAWLLVGTRTSLALYAVRHGRGLDMECKAHMALRDVRSVAWGPDVCVHAGDKMRWLSVDTQSGLMSMRGECSVGSACVTGLAWLGAWAWSTPMGVARWDDPSTRPTIAPRYAAHAAGHTSTDLVLSDHADLWGYARQRGLCATLTNANDAAPWRYMITHRLQCTLTQEEPTTIELGPTPVLAWRAWALWRECRGPEACGAMWESVKARLAELDAKVAHALQANTREEWSCVHSLAQQLAWVCKWPEAPAYGIDPGAIEWTCTWVGGMHRAAAIDSPSAYARRVAAALFCMAQKADGPEAPYLVKSSQCLLQDDIYAQWQHAHTPHLGETCPACGASIAFELAPLARCEAGHVFDRCVATYALLNGIDTLTCSGCARQASATALESLRTTCPSTSACTGCGNRWRR